MLRFTSLCAALLGKTFSTDLKILHESIMDEVRSIEFHRDHDFCVVKHLDSITDILAVDHSMGPVERRANAMIAFSDFVNAIVSSSPETDMRTFCEVLGSAVIKFYQIRTDPLVLMDTVITEAAHSLTLRTDFELLSIPGFMEPERQAAYRELMKIVFVDHRFPFRNMLKLHISMDLTWRIVGLANEMISRRDHYQSQHPEFVIYYPPIHALVRMMNSWNPFDLDVRLDRLASNLDLSDAELMFYRIIFERYNGPDCLLSSVYEEQMTSPEDNLIIRTMMERFVAVSEMGYVSEGFIEAFERGLRSDHPIAYFFAATESLKSEMYPVTTETHSWVSDFIPRDTLDGIRINLHLRSFVSDRNQTRTLIHQTVQAISHLYAKYATNPQRVKSLVQFASSLAGQTELLSSSRFWLGLLFEFDMRFGGEDLRLDLANLFDSLKGEQLSTLIKLRRKGPFLPIFSWPNFDDLRNVDTFYSSQTQLRSAGDMRVLNEIIRRYQTAKVYWYRYGQSWICPLDNLLQRFLINRINPEETLSLIDQVGNRLYSGMTASKMIPVVFPHGFEEVVSEFFLDDVMEEFHEIERYAKGRLISSKMDIKPYNVGIVMDFLHEMALLRIIDIDRSIGITDVVSFVKQLDFQRRHDDNNRFDEILLATLNARMFGRFYPTLLEDIRKAFGDSH